MLVPFREHGFGMLVVETRAGHEPVGICGLVRRPTLPAPDLGFAFLPEHRRHGYALEAGEAVLQDAQRRLSLPRILAITHPDNVGSIRVLERLGMVDAGQGKETAGTEPRLRVFVWEAPAASSASEAN